ncbi:hypothetical protein [Protaetiibacter larvae]|uniref:Uncharacterized protein n=1 Tax=Protaetiibacter larvae TaxID=2592654 RepID=A0A5C1Y5A5_9MICO|nr:hypothetical protein [Protaetiibacter larvae]QEO08890.1 hypothetical protein FLP23_01945 [Protaetiibacter larvae]
MPDPTPRTSWHDVPSLRATWAGAPSNDQRLADLLATAREWVELNAVEQLTPPAGDAPATIPTRFAEAQYLYARYIYETARVNAGADETGLDGYGGTTPGLTLGRIRGRLNPDPAYRIG